MLKRVFIAGATFVLACCVVGIVLLGLPLEVFSGEYRRSISLGYSQPRRFAERQWTIHVPLPRVNHAESANLRYKIELCRNKSITMTSCTVLAHRVSGPARSFIPVTIPANAPLGKNFVRILEVIDDVPTGTVLDRFALMVLEANPPWTGPLTDEGVPEIGTGGGTGSSRTTSAASVSTPYPY